MYRFLAALVAFFTLIQSMNLCAQVHVHASHQSHEATEILSYSELGLPDTETVEVTKLVRADHGLDRASIGTNGPTEQTNSNSETTNDCRFHIHNCCTAILDQNTASVAVAPLAENLSSEQLLSLTNFSENPEKPNWFSTVH
jgi:hypothetical protein